MGARLRLLISLLALLGVFAAGTTGYVLLAGASPGDAAYMTLITLSTVGFEEALDLDPVGRIWTAIVIVIGIGVVSVAYASLITLFVGGEFRSVLERRRVKSKIEHLEGHTVLCGFGRMGAMAADLLSQDRTPIVVVEAKKVARAELEQAGFLYVIGDATEEETLKAAGLMRATSLISALPGDADNVYVALTARSLRPDLHIVARAEQPAAEHKLRRAGANRVVCPQIIGAKRIADILLRPHVVDFFDVAARGVELEMDAYRVVPGSSLCGTTLRGAELRQRTGAMVVAITRADGTTLFHPEPDEVIRAEDQLILIGRTGTSSRLAELNY